jgi:hypothetical protein
MTYSSRDKCSTATQVSSFQLAIRWIPGALLLLGFALPVFALRFDGPGKSVLAPRVGRL